MISAYFQFAHDTDLLLDHLQMIMNDLRGQIANISVNANAHSAVWFSKDEDEQGDLTLYFIMRNNLAIVNRPYQPTAYKSGTNIDLTLYTYNIAGQKTGLDSA